MLGVCVVELRYHYIIISGFMAGLYLHTPAVLWLHSLLASLAIMYFSSAIFIIKSKDPFSFSSE